MPPLLWARDDVLGFSVSGMNAEVFCVGADSIEIVDANTGQSLERHALTGEVSCIAINPAERRYCAATSSGELLTGVIGSAESPEVIRLPFPLDQPQLGWTYSGWIVVNEHDAVAISMDGKSVYPLMTRWVDVNSAMDDVRLSPVLFELALEVMVRRDVPTYREFPRFPPAIRDLALVMPDSVPAAEVLADIEALRVADPLLAALRNVRLFDEYRGKGLENKEKSLAFRFWMQDTRRTLEDAEVDSAMRAITVRLGETREARLRSS
jgi:hypothetical protein